MTAAIAQDLIDRLHAVTNGEPTDDEIVISTDQAAMVDFAERTTHRQGRVYVRGMMLVQVVRDRGGMAWLRGAEGAPFVMPLKAERLRELIGSAATWRKIDKRSQRAENAMVPEWVPATLMQRGEWMFPTLEGVTDTPIIRPDGSIHDVPGYDARTGMLYNPGAVRWPAFKARPSRHDAAAAYAELAEPFCDFPFVAPSDRAAAIAATLSIVGRSAIPGCVPMFTFGATTPGSGKGLCADVCVTIGTGRDAPKMAAARDNEEMRKRLMAIALAAPSVVAFDNISGEFKSEALEMALTATSICDRILGVTEDRTVPLRAVFLMTGNNVRLGGDLPRRVVPVDLDPRMEHPEDRGGFRHPDLLAYVRRERPRLVVAALTILRAYCEAGKPSHGEAKGSYEDWDRLVRGAIVWAGGVDPLEGVARVRDRGDVERDQLRALHVAWRDALGDASVTVSRVLEAAGSSGALHDALQAYGRGDKPVTAVLLGSRLTKLRGRIVGEWILIDEGTAHGGSRLWRVGAA